jgi:hypothetical protein
MRAIVRNRRQRSIAGVLFIAAAVAPAWVHAAGPAPPVVAMDTIDQDMQQNLEESPSYTPPDPAAAAATQDPALAARRARMIKECEDNNGVDCANQVDVELGAELLQQGGVQRLAPPHAQQR